MAKDKDKIQLQVLDELCVKTMTSLNAAHSYLEAIAETEATRETAMARTKIDEALLWLGRYYSGVMMDLANKTCV